MPKHKQPLNIALIGQGFMGRVHSNAFRQVNFFFDTPYDVSLGVLCGRDSQKLEANAFSWGWKETALDWRQVIERKDIHVVDVAVPNSLHGPTAIAAAQAGKVVLCEKPLAMSLAEAQSMADAARNVPNLVWFNYRRIPAVSYAKRLIEEGRLGEIFHYRATYLNQSGNDPSKTSGWRYRREDSGSGVIGDLLSHSLDLALYLNGKISQLNAMTHTFAAGRDVDDAALLMVKFANGSVGTFEATRYALGYRNQNTFEIHGSHGMLSFNLEDMNRLEFFDASDRPNLQASRSLLVTGPNEPYSDNFWKPGHLLGYEHTFIATLGDFLHAIAKKEAFHANFEDGVAVQRILDATEESARTRSWIELS